MILHAIDAARSGGEVHIMSPDTDVFILALRYLPDLGTDAMIIHWSGSNQRILALQTIQDAWETH
jgi:hypothetical protein